MWRRAVVAVSVALLATGTQAQTHVCPDGQFPVSVLNDPQVRCITSRPCSGVYGPEGLIAGVGACPTGTGCALLPQNPSVMGCVVAGRDDVSYVNPDGSLTKGGKVISGPPANNNSGNNANNGAQPTAAPTTATSTAPTPTATNTNGGANNGGANNGGANNANNANKNVTSPAPTTAAPATTLPTTPGSVKPGGGDDATSPTPTTTSASPAKTDAPSATTPTTTTGTPTNSQNALDDISGEIANNKRGVDAKSLGFSSIIAIVVGCLAVVAVIAGVFVLRKKKEQAIGTPEGALEDYGAGGVTPKENVLLL